MRFSKTQQVSGCLSLLLAFGLTPAGAQEASIPEQAAGQAKAVRVQTDSSLAALLTEIQSLPWPKEKERRTLDLKDVWAYSRNDIDVRLAEEQIDQAHEEAAQLQEEHSPFFGLVVPESLKQSGRHKIQAATVHREAVSQKTILENTERYFAVIKALMGRYTAYQSIQQAGRQLKLDQGRFISGEITNIDVMRTQGELIHRYDDFLKLQNAYQAASYALAHQLAQHPDTLYNPDDLKLPSLEREPGKASQDAASPLISSDIFRSGKLMEAFQELARQAEDGKSIEKFRKTALQQRPDLAELSYQKSALEDLLKGTDNPLFGHKSEYKVMKSQVKQLGLQIEQARSAIETQVLKAVDDSRLAQERLTLADEQLKLAAKALRQVEISQQAGFSSSKDVLDAQVGLAQARVLQGNALLDNVFSQVQLLYALGLLDPDKLLRGDSLWPVAPGQV